MYSCQNKYISDTGFENMAAQDMKNVFAREELEADVTKCMENGNYQEALVALEKLLPLQSNTWSKISTMLKITDCQMMLNLHRPTVRSLDDVVYVAIQANINFNDVVAAADNLLEKKNSYIQGFGMCYLASKLCKATTTGDDAARGISNCVEKVREAIEIMMKTTEDRGLHQQYKEILTGHIIPALKEVVEDLNKIEDASKKVLIEEKAWCHLHIAKCFFVASDFKSAKSLITKTINLLKAEYKDDAEKHHVFAECHLDMAHVLEREDWKKAAACYAETMNLLQKAEDFDNDEQKQEEIEKATKKFNYAGKTCIIL